jgi:FixJ family two-component response regulator
MRMGTGSESTVVIVDDGEEELGGAADTLEAAGFVVDMVSSPSLAAERSMSCRSACILLDLHGRSFDPLQLPAALVKAGCTAPVIFLAERTDIRGSVLAMKSGAMDVLVKPVNRDELLSAIRVAMAQDLAARLAHTLRNERSQRFAQLTPREHEICGWVSNGLLNKQIAARLGIAEKTVKVHRGQAMRKLGVRSVPELVRIVDGLHPVHADTRASYQVPAQWPGSIPSMRSGEAISRQIADRGHATPPRDDRQAGL